MGSRPVVMAAVPAGSGEESGVNRKFLRTK